MFSRDYEIIATDLQFPEGPIALPDGSVLLVEIARGSLTRIDTDGSKEIVAMLGGGPNGAAIGPDGLCYVCNNGGFEWAEQNGMLFPIGPLADYQGGRIEVVDLKTGKFDTLYKECNSHQLKGPNDLMFDSHGGFWFTDTGKTYGRTVDRSGVYYAKADGSAIDEVLYGFELCNGVGLSPDESTLYFSETLAGRLWQFNLASPGTLAKEHSPFNPEDLLYSHKGLVGYDSLAMEANGNVCQATLFTGGVSVVSPAGEEVEFIAYEDPFVTNICFGGDDLQTAFITLSGTGQLVKMPWPRPGLALPYLNK